MSWRAVLPGGVAALLLGMVCLDLLPPLGLVEVVCALALLFTRRSGAILALLAATAWVLLAALLVMIMVSGFANPVMAPLAGGAVLVAGLLLHGATSSGARRAAGLDGRPGR